jgi:hypothetical protein
LPPAPLTPPPSLPPRPTPSGFILRRMGSEGSTITGGIFGLLGFIFSFLGCGLSLAVVTLPVGIPFLLIGLAFLPIGAGLVIWRYQTASKVERALREGQAALGEITSVEANYSMQINGRNPWVISYRFQAVGTEYSGSLQTLTPPGERFQPGVPAYVVYLPEDPRANTLYL